MCGASACGVAVVYTFHACQSGWKPPPQQKARTMEKVILSPLNYLLEDGVFFSSCLFLNRSQRTVVADRPEITREEAVVAEALFEPALESVRNGWHLYHARHEQSMRAPYQ